MSTEVRAPTLGESVSEATVATWFKKVGDAVAADEMLCELETDKVTVEVPAPAAGVLSEIIAAEGETVGVSALLAMIAEGAAAPAKAPTPAAKAEAAPAPAKATEDAPSAKKAMAEAGLSPDQVTGTGRDGRIMKEDVQRAVAAPTAAPAPAAAPAPVSIPETSSTRGSQATGRLWSTRARPAPASASTTTSGATRFSTGTSATLWPFSEKCSGASMWVPECSSMVSRQTV
jgi:2-oxoglutarate dehydrogenase E2 component (dihydrolipoamide succinyltransferase)